jgi:hypothetical protein
MADGTPLYVRAEVPAAQIAALQGVTRTLFFDNGSSSRDRVDSVELAKDAGVSSASWEGSIRIPVNGQYDFYAGQGVEIFIDGHNWTESRYLGQGLYSLKVSLPPAVSQEVDFTWKQPDKEFGKVPPRYLFSLPGPRQGLLAAYWSNPKWEGPPLFQQVTPYLVISWPPGQEVVPSGEFSAVFSGMLSVSHPGQYSFRVIADDGARLTLDGTVLGTALEPGRGNEFEATANLVEGLHPIKVEYFQAGGASGLGLFWRQGDQPWSPVPPSALIPPSP